MYPPPGEYQANPLVGAYQGNPPVGAYQANPPVGAYQANPPVGTYQANPPVGTYQVNPPVGIYQANPPVGMHQASPTTNTMAATGPQQTFNAFDRKKVKGYSISLIVLGCVPIIINLIAINVPGVAANALTIVAGVIGIISSKQPSNGKIVAFMVLNIINAVFCIIAALISALVIVASTTYESWNFLSIAGILALTFNLAQTIVSIYCSVLAGRQVGCCGCDLQNQQGEGVVHGQIHQAVVNEEKLAPVVQYQQFQNVPNSPPPYSQAIQHP